MTHPDDLDARGHMMSAALTLSIRALAESVAELESRILEVSGMDGTVLRYGYGWFYGPGTNYDPRWTGLEHRKDRRC